MTTLGTATNKKLFELYDQMQDGSLILAPYLQKKVIWNNQHKEKFIETILCQLPFPEIYLVDGDIDPETETSKTVVVDGQQRLSTIYEYITEDPYFNLKTIPKFSKLSPEEKKAFFDYVIVVRDLGRISQDKIKDIFHRIDSVRYALNAVEIQDCLYEGEFITTAKEILEDNQSLFESLDLFSNIQSFQMKDLEYILLILSTIQIGGYFRGDREVENYVQRYDDEYSPKSEVISLVKQVFDLILECQLKPDSLWNTKSSFFSLTIELIKLKKKQNFLPNSEQLKNLLDSLEQKIQQNKNNDIEQDECAKYYHYTYAEITSKKARDIRGEFLRKELYQLIPQNVVV